MKKSRHEFWLSLNFSYGSPSKETHSFFPGPGSPGVATLILLYGFKSLFIWYDGKIWHFSSDFLTLNFNFQLLHKGMTVNGEWGGKRFCTFVTYLRCFIPVIDDCRWDKGGTWKWDDSFQNSHMERKTEVVCQRTNWVGDQTQRTECLMSFFVKLRNTESLPPHWS